MQTEIELHAFCLCVQYRQSYYTRVLEVQLVAVCQHSKAGRSGNVLSVVYHNLVTSAYGRCVELRSNAVIEYRNRVTASSVKIITKR